MKLYAPAPHAATARQTGFSLVELSIVLVILGLLVGGILGGQSLIHAAELRSVIKEHEQYQTAIMSFRGKYLAFPGDMANATSFWGRADNGSFSGQCASPSTNTGTGTQTCNGNGDGVINTFAETVRFWQHLANAGLISGTYTGVAGSGGPGHSEIGVNVPESKMGNGIGWAARETIGSATGGGSLWDEYPARDLLRVGAETSSSILSGNVFTPADAWNIDTKLDDGKPASGTIWTRGWQNCTTAANSGEFDADYNLSNESVSCSLFFFFRR